MTIKEKLQNMLVSKGMFDSQAKEVIELAIPELNDLCNDYNINFDGCSSTYPNAIYNILFLAIKPIALNWIEEKQPFAWYKPIFE